MNKHVTDLIAAIQTAVASVLSGITSIDGKLSGTWTPATSEAPADEGVISAAPTVAMRIMVANSHPTDTVYLQVFDSDTVPIDGTSPRIPSVQLVAGQTEVLWLDGLTCSTGLSWASSSTVATKTVTAITPLQVSAELR